jgi:hypothetical protein
MRGSVKLGKSVRVNFGPRGRSVTVGGRNAKVTFGSTGGRLKSKKNGCLGAALVISFGLSVLLFGSLSMGVSERRSFVEAPKNERVHSRLNYAPTKYWSAS